MNIKLLTEQHLEFLSLKGGCTGSSSGSFTILGLWVLGLAAFHINESNCKLMSPEHYFNDKSAILLHPGTR